jgi:hypothetical protein
VIEAAGEWYTDGTLWAAVGGVGTAVGVVIGLITLWRTVLDPNKRRLFYSMPTVAPLLRQVGADLEVRHEGQLLALPYAVKVQLVSRGRKDIPSSSFDNGEPIILDVGAPIVTGLSVDSDTDTMPPHVVKGTELHIGPGLIRKRQTLTFTLLTDGRPTLTCRNSLIDVQVLKQTSEPTEISKTRAWQVITLTLVAGWLVAAMAGQEKITYWLTVALAVPAGGWLAERILGWRNQGIN